MPTDLDNYNLTHAEKNALLHAKIDSAPAPIVPMLAPLLFGLVIGFFIALYGADYLNTRRWEKMTSECRSRHGPTAKVIYNEEIGILQCAKIK